MLLPKKSGKDIFEIIAPGNMAVGVMLPYSPLYYLLFEKTGLEMLVVTSLNKPSSPTIKDNKEAGELFNGKILEHNLEIGFRCDDSVLKSSPAGPVMIRRSRGFVPEGIEMPVGADVLSSGASENIAFCFTRGAKAYPSQYLGDMEEVSTQEIYLENIIRWKKVWNYSPKMLAKDAETAPLPKY